MTSVVTATPTETGPSRPDPVQASRPRGTTSAVARAMRPDVLRIVGRGITLLGFAIAAFLVFLLVLTPLLQGRDQAGLERRFRQHLETQQAWIGGEIPEGEPIAQLRIPSLGVEEIVVEGTSGTQLRKGPGHLRASALPGQAGNAVIAGRARTYGGPFHDLGDLREDDLIITTTGQAAMRYRVTAVREVEEDQEDVLGPARDHRLTLVTSAGFPNANRRLVVTAELRGQPLPTLVERPDELRTDELGLNGDRSGGFSLLVWVEALVVASLLAVWLRRRWSRWSTWLVAAPVLALLLVLVFDSFAPVLPSTL